MFSDKSIYSMQIMRHSTGYTANICQYDVWASPKTGDGTPFVFLGRENDEKPWIGMGVSVPTLANGSSFQQKPPFQYWARCSGIYEYKNRIWLVV